MQLVSVGRSAAQPLLLSAQSQTSICSLLIIKVLKNHISAAHPGKLSTYLFRLSFEQSGFKTLSIIIFKHKITLPAVLCARVAACSTWHVNTALSLGNTALWGSGTALNVILKLFSYILTVSFLLWVVSCRSCWVSHAEDVPFGFPASLESDL